MFLYRLVKSYANILSIRGITKAKRRSIRSKILRDLELKLRKPTLENISPAIQDLTFPNELRSAEKIMVILVPGARGINGGILSIFSIAAHMRKLKLAHGYEVGVMTLPSTTGETYFRNTFFRNEENVYRFEQIVLCEAAKEIYIHIPECTAAAFTELLSVKEKNFLANLQNVRINILNQNIRQMPKKEALFSLREISSNLSQSVAHHAYYNQKTANLYGLPTLLLPAYTDLSAYPRASFVEKESLIIYSPDNAPHKQECLQKLKQALPNFQLVEIRDISFDKYMDLATRCMFSITFGEGFDGYLAQPIYQGGLGFAVYNEDFFPSPSFKQYDNIFQSPQKMLSEICITIESLSKDQPRYEALNRALMEEYGKLYSFEGYVKQLKKLSLQQAEYLPSPEPKFEQASK